MNHTVGRPTVRADRGPSATADLAPEPALRVVCAWCQTTPAEPEPGTTHGICPSCLERELGQLAFHDDGAVWRNMRYRLTLT